MLVLAAIRNAPRALAFASAALRADRQLVLAAVHKEGDALQFASAALRADCEVALAAVAQDGDALRHVAAALRADREIVLAAVAQNAWFALEYAAAELKADREVVLVAVANDGRALSAASQELREDRQVVLTAFQQNDAALTGASRALLEDRTFLLECICLCGDADRVFLHGPAAGGKPTAVVDLRKNPDHREFVQQLVDEARVVRGGGALIGCLQRLAFAGSLQPGFRAPAAAECWVPPSGGARYRALKALHEWIGCGCYLGDGTVELHRYLPPRVALAVVRRTRQQGWAWHSSRALLRPNDEVQVHFDCRLYEKSHQLGSFRC
eukprot:SAG31_NODE_478_length_15144_cov_15.165769_16_plen_325_part_00